MNDELREQRVFKVRVVNIKTIKHGKRRVR